MSQLFMRLSGFSDLPAPEARFPYRLRSCAEGDERSMAEAFRPGFGDVWTAEKVYNELIRNQNIGPGRIFVAAREDRVVATASAWVRTDRFPDAGYLHMVAVLPEHRREGLGRAVSLAALHCFRRLGFDAAVLHTDDFRRPAVSLYLGLGFRPVIVEADHAARWIALCKDLGRPEIIETMQGH